MINKKGIWFLTLFSLILVLSVYYVTMPNELLLTGNSNYMSDKDKAKTVSKETSKKNESKATVKMKESELLTNIRVEANEKYNSELEKLKTVLTNKESTTEDKNNAFEQMKTINNNRGKEELIEKKILEQYKNNACVLISGTDIIITINSDKHDTKLANNIMRLTQSEFEVKMYITIKFQK